MLKIIMFCLIIIKSFILILHSLKIGTILFRFVDAKDMDKDFLDN